MKTWVTLLIFGLTLNACERHHQSADNSSNLNGIWDGSIMIDGREQPINLDIVQQGGAIVHAQGTGSFLSIDHSGTMMAALSGSVSGDTFTLTADEGTQCVQKWTVSGQVRGRTMILTIAGNGNDLQGTTCYPRPLNQVVTLGH